MAFDSNDVGQSYEAEVRNMTERLLSQHSHLDLRLSIEDRGKEDLEDLQQFQAWLVESGPAALMAKRLGPMGTRQEPEDEDVLPERILLGREDAGRFVRRGRHISGRHHEDLRR